jgi:hypothetical protein
MRNRVFVLTGLIIAVSVSAAIAQIPQNVSGRILFGTEPDKLTADSSGQNEFKDPKHLFGMAVLDKRIVELLNDRYQAHLQDEKKDYPGKITFQIMVYQKQDGNWQQKGTGLWEQRTSPLYDTFTDRTFPLEIVADVEFYKTKRDYYSNSTFSQWPATVMNTLGKLGAGTHEICIVLNSMDAAATGSEDAIASGELTIELSAEHASWLQNESKAVRRYKRDYREDQKIAEMEETWRNATTITTNTGRQLQVRDDGIFENREPLGRIDNGRYIMGIFVVGQTRMNEYQNTEGGALVKIERAAPGKAEYIFRNASNQEIGRILEDGTILKGSEKWGQVKFSDPSKLELDDERTRIALALWHHSSYFRS